jgi:signal transduction histidine kinase
MRRLAETFNTTAAELDQLLRSQDAFVADASHQLRTPLAALRLRLENLDRDVTPSGKDELDGALTEVERLSTLVDGLLTLARADRALKAPERIAVSRVVDERLAAWTALAEERGVALRRDVSPDAVGLATPGRLEQVLDNLLANALDVSPAGATITISASTGDGWIELQVVDEGPGLSAEERGRAFDRFWRAPGRDGEGSGLGLAIVQRLAAADGGSVSLEPSSAGGLAVVVRLPKAGPARSGSPAIPTSECASS